MAERGKGRAQGRKDGRREEAARTRREQRAMLVRQAGRKFSSETGERLAAQATRCETLEDGSMRSASEP